MAYQPAGLWEEASNAKYKQAQGEDLYRRSLYTFWKRAAPPALMDILNAPSRETCAVRRERTNTPLQALATLNDPQFVEAARKLAELALQKAGSEDPQKAELVKLRYFAGLSVEESAQVLGVSEATVSRWWVYARAWLGREIKF